jgi:hypothetical protein
MASTIARRVTAAVVLAAGLVLAGHLFAAPPVRHLGYDATAYVAMAEGHGARVPAPFKFRVLVPLLAGWLPLAAPDALQAITYTCLFGAYLFMLRAGTAAGLSPAGSAFGVLAVWGSTWHLYHYYNPYMTDGAGLLALGAMVSALLTDTLALFAVAAIAGVLVRESTLALVPAWIATKQAGRTLSLLAAAGLAAWLPRYLMAAEGPSILPFNPAAIPEQGVLVWIRQLYAIWGLVWLVGAGGLVYLPAAHATKVVAAFAAISVGAAAASVSATDTGRMFAFLAPVLAIGCGQFYDVLARTNRTLARGLVAIMVVQGVFNAPAVVFDPSAWIAGWPRRLFLLAELALGGFILAALIARHRQRREPLSEA